MYSPQHPQESAPATASRGAAPTAGEWLIYRVGDCRRAIELEAVVRVVRAVAVSPAASTTPLVLGYIDVKGELVPVVDVRVHEGLPSRPVTLEDRFVLVRCHDYALALKVDAVEGLAAGRVATQSAPLLGLSTAGVVHDGERHLLARDLEGLLTRILEVGTGDAEALEVTL